MRLGRYDMRLLHEAPQRTAFHDWYDTTTPLQRKVAFALGATMVVFVIVFSSIHMFMYLFHQGPDHAHALLDLKFIAWMIVMFLMGSSLMMPTQTLALIAIIPLPPFLRRNGKGIADVSKEIKELRDVVAGGHEGEGNPYAGPDRRKQQVPIDHEDRRTPVPGAIRDPWPDEEG